MFDITICKSEGEITSRNVQTLQQQQVAAQNQLQKVHGEVIQLAGDAAVDSPTRFDRLLALQKETESTEQRLAVIADELQGLQSNAFDEAELLTTLKQFESVWESLTTREQARLINLGTW